MSGTFKLLLAAWCINDGIYAIIKFVSLSLQLLNIPYSKRIFGWFEVVFVSLNSSGVVVLAYTLRYPFI